MSELLNCIKRNRIYFILIPLVFLLTLYKYGLETAVLALIMLTSMFYLILNGFYSYGLLIKKRSSDHNKEIFWRIGGFVFFLVVLLILPEKLTIFSLIFCSGILIAFLIYDSIKKVIK